MGAGIAAGSSSDAAPGSLAQGLVQGDPESALAWALSIQNEAARVENLAQLSNAWMQDDPDAARAALAAAALTDAERAAVEAAAKRKEAR